MGIVNRKPRLAPAGSIAALLRAMETAGVDPGPWLEELALDSEAVRRPDARVPPAKILRAHALAQRMSLPPGFWLELGDGAGVHSYHLELSNWLLTAENLAAVMPIMARLYGSYPRPGPVSSADGRVRVVLGGRRNNAANRHAVELAAATTARGLTIMHPDESFQLRFEFGFPEPDHGDRYRAVLGPHVLFDQDGSCVWIPARLFFKRLGGHDPAMHRIYEQELEEKFYAPDAKDELLQEVRRILSSAPGDDMPTIVQTSAALSMSERSLRRRLKEQGSSYRALILETKMASAGRLLERSDAPIEDVAAELGFSDYSNFRRAFQSWHGVSPSRYRARRR